jgi:hypothetical protein
MEDTKTFTANVRCDFRYIDKIAKYLASKGVFMGTKSRVASEAIRILAHGIPEVFNTIGYGDALRSLRRLGYNDEPTDKTGYYRELNRVIEIEGGQRAVNLERDREAMRLTKEFNERHSHAAPPNMSGIEAILEPEPEPEPESEPKEKPEPEPESKQLKERTPADEAKDIKKLQSAMAIPDGAPLENLEEVTSRAGTDDD